MALCVCVRVRVRVRVRVCVISNQNTSKKPHYMSDLSKFDALLHKTQQDHFGTKVPGLDMCRSIILLSKITHQVCSDHPFSQRNETTKRAVGVELEDDREREGVEVGIIGSVFIK